MRSSRGFGPVTQGVTVTRIRLFPALMIHLGSHFLIAASEG
ncbi:hypothetical protein [Synechococcus sp. M16CYN]